MWSIIFTCSSVVTAFHSSVILSRDKKEGLSKFTYLNSSEVLVNKNKNKREKWGK